MQNPARGRFGPFEVDAQEHQLRRDGIPVGVTRKSLSLLIVLLGRPGKLFTKAELFETVWAGTVVSDAALSRAIRELRVVLGDDAGAPRFIATVHGVGFRFVGPIEGEPTTPTNERREAARLRLVARTGELSLLDAGLAAARAGRRQIVFVTGEAGIGKTALVEAFLEQQTGGGDLWAAQGRCIEQYGTGEAFLPMLEALENLTPQIGAKPLRDLLARYAPGWLAQLPWLTGPAPALEPRYAGAATTAQGMLREIAQALEVLAEQRPVVLWLEDLHWSDPSTLTALSFIAGRPQPARLLLIASFRPADARNNESPLHGLAPRLAQRDQARELALGLLDVTAIAAHLSNRFGKLAGVSIEALAAFLHRRTEGNALFVVTLVDDLVRRGLLAPQEGGWQLKVRLAELASDLPESLRQLVQHQFGSLAAAERRLIEAAAVAGTDFSAASVAAALQEDVADVEDRFALLAEQGKFLQARAPVAWPDGTVSAGYGFQHALYWHGIDERVSHSRRAEWQGRIARREEAACGGHCGPIAAELAMRFEQAGAIEPSLRYLQMAGAGALARHAYVESIGLLRHALALLPRLPVELQPRQELDLLLPLGAALMAAQGYASGDVEATYQRALALCRTSGRPGDLERVLRGLWNVVFLRSDLEQAAAAAEELRLLAVEGGNPVMLFDAYAKLGQTNLHRGNLAAARAQLEQALELAAGAEDPTRLRDAPRVLVYLAWVLWHVGESRAALARADEAMALAGRAGSPHTRAFVLGYASLLHVFVGDMPGAFELARRQTELSFEHDLVYWRVMGEFTQALVAARRGEIEAGSAAMSEAIAAMRSTGAEVGVWYLLCLHAEAEIGAGRTQPARAALDGCALGLGEDRNGAEIGRLRGELALLEGSDPAIRDRAAGHFAAARALAQHQGARAFELRAALSLAALWVATGEPAERILQILVPVRDGFGDDLQTADLRRANALIDSLHPGSSRHGTFAAAGLS
ncbi:MAG: AAA family ATPase [Caldimonas sp.]